MTDNDFDSVFPRGEKNEAFAQYFIGQSYLSPLTTEGVAISNVTFEPGCRNNWHIHHASAGGGQILLCTAGSGWYQAEGREPMSLQAGVVVVIPAGLKHWHGAKADSWFSHLAIAVPGENPSNEWCEPVTDEYYNHLR
ncbi:cupin domain-containing protein [Propionicimonas sp.]|uniref:cupin domain-containing protein n=1 Tax=Propionicimonas sp. TaxID=1955623 RepID=UPI0039E26E77